MNETRYRVTGMTCGGCARALGQALERTAPGLDYQVELEADVLVVRGEHDPSLIAAAVDEAGFDFGGVAVPG